MRDRKKQFVRLAEARVNKTLRLINLIGNLSNRTNYDWTSDEADKIEDALHHAIEEMRERYRIVDKLGCEPEEPPFTLTGE